MIPESFQPVVASGLYLICQVADKTWVPLIGLQNLRGLRVDGGLSALVQVDQLAGHGVAGKAEKLGAAKVVESTVAAGAWDRW